MSDINYQVVPFANMPERPVCASVQYDGFQFDAFGATKVEAKKKLEKKIEAYCLAKARAAEEEDPQ